MEKSHGRVPKKVSEFNDYITRTDDDLLVVVPPSTQPTWQRLGLTTAYQTLWHNGRLTWEPLYALYANPLTKTTAVVKQVREFMAAATKNLMPMLNVMAASLNALPRDEEMYNFIRVNYRKKPTHHTGEIYEQCYTTIIAKGGGVIQIKCRSNHDETRASMPDGTGVAEVLCKAVNSTPDPAMEANPPTDFDDPTLNIRETFTKATFALSLGGGVKGKFLEGYVRWRDAHNPKRVGQWTQIAPTVIT